jgi:ubiquinone/menaquinone biosynthesis C-methylase UbiE
MASESVKFDRVADIYDATRGLPEREVIPTCDLIVQAAGLNEKSCVLEVGVGTGRVAVPLAEKVGAMFGIDLSRPMLSTLPEEFENPDAPLAVEASFHVQVFEPAGDA